jgi:hypothetical protein
MDSDALGLLATTMGPSGLNSGANLQSALLYIMTVDFSDYRECRLPLAFVAPTCPFKLPPYRFAGLRSVFEFRHRL